MLPRLLALAAALLLPQVGLAASVYLNGVNIDGVKNQTFNNCSVQIDANGNVFITAKGYAVGGSTAATATPAPPPADPAQPAPTPTPAPPAAVTQHYWLVTEKAAPGMSQYDIELYVNAKFVRKFLDDEEQVVFELTKHLAPGANKVTLLAKKSTAARRSSSPQHYFRLVVGEGDSGGRNIMITKRLIDYKRTALETKDFKDEFVITTR